MAMSQEELRERLSAIEPTEDTYRGIGADEVPMLRELLDDDEGWLAARAVFALSRVDAPEARDELRATVEHPREEVRVAAAAAAERLPVEQSDPILSRLLEDSSVGVRKFAITSVSQGSGPDVRAALDRVARADSEHVLRSMAAQHAEGLRAGR